MNIENLDHDEVNKFDEIASKWWDDSGEFKPLHQINPLRVGFIKDRVELKGKKILDVGCGGGILSEALSELGAEVTGIDASENTIGVAKAHSKTVNSKVNYIQTTIEQFTKNNPNEMFDVITCLEMLEHVPSPGAIIETCSDILKDNGDIFFSTINRNPKSFLFAIIGAEYILNLLPKGTHEYSKFITPAELRDWCLEIKLDVTSIIGMSYNPFLQKYKLGDDTSVNYIVEVKGRID